jgi:hypothetical protein
MDDSAQLALFIERGVKAYPANKYFLIFWDHGAGWPGFGGDDTYASGDYLGIMTLPHIDSGIQQVRATDASLISRTLSQKKKKNSKKLTLPFGFVTRGGSEF